MMKLDANGYWVLDLGAMSDEKECLVIEVVEALNTSQEDDQGPA
jgi:hypothetical protein